MKFQHYCSTALFATKTLFATLFHRSEFRCEKGCRTLFATLFCCCVFLINNVINFYTNINNCSVLFLLQSLYSFDKFVIFHSKLLISAILRLAYRLEILQLFDNLVEPIELPENTPSNNSQNNWN